LEKQAKPRHTVLGFFFELAPRGEVWARKIGVETGLGNVVGSERVATSSADR